MARRKSWRLGIRQDACTIDCPLPAGTAAIGWGGGIPPLSREPGHSPFPSRTGARDETVGEIGIEGEGIADSLISNHDERDAICERPVLVGAFSIEADTSVQERLRRRDDDGVSICLEQVEQSSFTTPCQ